jgi:hypothetical protein
MIAKVIDDIADRRNECWWGQWWRDTLGHDSEYEIVQDFYGLASQQRVSLILQGFDDLTENEKDELFKNSIQAYVQYPEELK